MFLTIKPYLEQSLELCGNQCDTLIASHMGNYMLPVPELAIQTISLSTQKLEQAKVLCIHKYMKIKHIRQFCRVRKMHSEPKQNRNSCSEEDEVIYIQEFVRP